MNSIDQFEAIVSAYYEPLFRFGMSLTQAESDARDLTQQTFYIWATRGHQLRDSSKAKTWLFTTLHRAFLESRRRGIRFPHYDLEAVADQLPVQAAEPADNADCSQVLPALARVDAVYRAAVALFYLEDCSYKGIAEILEVPIGTVKSRIARGIAQLREILLTDVSRDLSFNCHENAPVDTDESATSSELTRPLPTCNDRLAAGTVERVYAEWDFSSTRFREPFGAARLVNSPHRV